MILMVKVAMDEPHTIVMGEPFLGFLDIVLEGEGL